MLPVALTCWMTDVVCLFVEDAASLYDIHSSNKGSDNLSHEGVLRALYEASGGNMEVMFNGVRQVLLHVL